MAHCRCSSYAKRILTQLPSAEVERAPDSLTALQRRSTTPAPSLCKQEVSFGRGLIRTMTCRVPNSCPVWRATTVTHGYSGSAFSLHLRKLPSQSITVLVFQAGHASSILVTRSMASPLVTAVLTDSHAGGIESLTIVQAGHVEGRTACRPQVFPLVSALSWDARSTPAVSTSRHGGPLLGHTSGPNCLDGHA
jgi:hypothetical protein